MLNLKNKTILLTGGNGFLGKYVQAELHEQGVDKNDIIIPDSSKDDLREKTNCERLVKDIDIIVHLAAKVGGIGYNQNHPGDLFYDNLLMGVQLMEQARLASIEKFVSVGTICAYPKFTPTPFKEDDLWNGYPEETNAPYGLAKKMLLVQSQAYRQQYGFNAIYLLPVNLYGPGDNFDPTSSHVIPALIRKVAKAKKQNLPFIEVWGTGQATREFIYVADAARAIVQATIKYDKSEPINIGSGGDITIKELVEKICQLMEYQGEIKWNIKKPDGQPKRLLDISRAQAEFDFTTQTDFTTGLKNTIDWYLANFL